MEPELPDAEALARIITSRRPQKRARGCKPDLDEHLKMVRREFVGRPTLEYLHAEAIVRIRRELDLPADLARFFAFWRHHEPALLSGLSARWLISACDTFADHGDNDADRCAGLAGALFMNTIKLYETERLQGEIIPDLVEWPRKPLPLFDGMARFAGGRGDMIRNLFARVQADGLPDRPAVRILQELVRRARANDTVYGRMAAIHTVDETRF